MKTVFFIFAFACFSLLGNSQNSVLKAELIKENNQYFKTLNNGSVEFSFYLQGIQSKTQADNLEKYIRGYRGVEEFNLVFDAAKNEYKANGIFYSSANWSYFKYMFKIMKVDQVLKENQWNSLEQINNL